VVGVREEEDSAHPIPDKVQVGGSPVFLVDRRLGKGGFGQVFLGKRQHPAKRGTAGPPLKEVALKLEHKTSKGCSGGSPYEWTIYQVREGGFSLFFFIYLIDSPCFYSIYVCQASVSWCSCPCARAFT
jgi:hypothetical protein